MSVKAINYANSSYTNLPDTIGFISTLSSSGLNVSRTGARRVNLNDLVNPNTSPGDTNAIRTELNNIIGVITNQAPNFGQRFYRVPTSATNSSWRERPACHDVSEQNRREYQGLFGFDSVPTQVTTGGAIYADGAPQEPLGSGRGSNPFWAIGKENVPRLQEVIIHVPQLRAMAGQGAGACSWDIRIAYYARVLEHGDKGHHVGRFGAKSVYSSCGAAGLVRCGKPRPLLI